MKYTNRAIRSDRRRPTTHAVPRGQANVYYATALCGFRPNPVPPIAGTSRDVWSSCSFKETTCEACREILQAREDQA